MDCGGQFELALFCELTQLLSTDHVRTTTYHPAANSMVEHFHCQLKSSLKMHDNSMHWTYVIPIAVLGMQAALKDDLGCFTAEPVYDAPLHLPRVFFLASHDTLPNATKRSHSTAAAE